MQFWQRFLKNIKNRKIFGFQFEFSMVFNFQYDYCYNTYLIKNQKKKTFWKATIVNDTLLFYSVVRVYPRSRKDIWRFSMDIVCHNWQLRELLILRLLSICLQMTITRHYLATDDQWEMRKYWREQKQTALIKSPYPLLTEATDFFSCHSTYKAL